MNIVLRTIALGALAMLGGTVIAHAGNEYFPRFNALQDSEDVRQYYNGGYGTDDPTDCPSLPAGSGNCYGPASDGPGNSGPGPNWGLTFSTGAQVISDIPTAYDLANGLPASGNFSNGPQGDLGLVWVSSNRATIHIPIGFTTGVAFYYSAEDGNPTGSLAGQVTLWSGAHDNGTLIATINLYDTGDDFLYDDWAIASAAFSGVVESIDFAGAENNVIFEVVSIGVTTPNLAITSDTEKLPEPASVGLLGAAIMALGLVRWRRAAIRR